MQPYKLLTAAIHFEKVLQVKQKLLPGERKRLTVTKYHCIMLHKLSLAVTTSKGMRDHMSFLRKGCNPSIIHRSFQVLMQQGYCKRSRYGMAYYYKITPKGLSLLSIIEDELQAIVNAE